jgi:hypothetical protein
MQGLTAQIPLRSERVNPVAKKLSEPGTQTGPACVFASKRAMNGMRSTPQLAVVVDLVGQTNCQL